MGPKTNAGSRVKTVGAALAVGALVVAGAWGVHAVDGRDLGPLSSIHGGSGDGVLHGATEPGEARTDRTPAGVGETEAPLRVVGGRLVVTVTASGGHSLDFLLSTGNAVTVLSETTAANLGEQTFWLGDAQIDTDSPYEIPDGDLLYGGERLAGIVGANTLSAYDVLLDAPGGRVVLKDIGPRVEWPGAELGEPVRLRIFHGIVISLDISVNGTEYGAMLDTGSSPVLVNAGAARALGIEEAGKAVVRVGAREMADADVRVSDVAVFDRWDPNGDGFAILGAPVAIDCAVSISWVHQEMRMCTR